MDHILNAIAAAIDSTPGWIVLILLLILVGGLSDAVARTLSGRGALKATRAQLKSVEAENTRLHELALRTTAQRALATGIQNEDVAALAAQTSTALEDRAEGLHLLLRVQATDNVYPQLPQELRTEIDTHIAGLKARRVPDNAEGTPVPGERYWIS